MNVKQEIRCDKCGTVVSRWTDFAGHGHVIRICDECNDAMITEADLLKIAAKKKSERHDEA